MKAKNNLTSGRPFVRASSSPGGAAAGFTMLEVLVAITIFAIVSTALYTTFRTGMRAYDSGIHTGELMQTGRFAMDSLRRDLKNIYYLTESAYNRQYNLRREELDRMMLSYDNGSGNFEEIRDKLADFNDNMIGIDLSFTGSGDENISEVSFVRYQDRSSSRPAQPFSLARVTYSIENENFVRKEENVLRPPLDDYGEELELPASAPEILVRGVQQFSILYGFYYDGEWRESYDWASGGHENRADNLMPTYVSNQGDFNSALGDFVESWQKRQPQDDLPGYIRIRLVVADTKRASRTRAFSQTIDVAQGIETHVPIDDQVEIGPENNRRKIGRDQLVREPKAVLRKDRIGLEGDNERPRRGQAGQFILR